MPSTTLLTIYKGLSTKLGQSTSDASKLTHDGRLYLTTDDGFLYYDVPDANNVYGATPTSSTRKAINAGHANSAAQVDNAINFYINSSYITNTYNGSTGNSVYIGSDLIIGPASNTTTNTASTENNNLVYLNYLVQSGTNGNYSRKAGVSLSGLGIIKVYTDNAGNITFKAPSILTEQEVSTIWNTVFSS